MLSFMHEYVTCTCQKQAMLLSTIKHANANLIKKGNRITKPIYINSLFVENWLNSNK